jgi:hypothetical protein
MKIKLLSGSLLCASLLVGCGAEERLYDNPATDLFACVQGTWDVHQSSDPRWVVEHTVTYNADGTYIDVTINEHPKNITFSFLNFLGADIPLLDYTSKVILEAGRYNVNDGYFFRKSLKRVTTTGNDQQATYSDALSLLASTPETQSTTHQVASTYCDSQYLEPSVFQKISESPLAYVFTVQAYDENELSQVRTGTITLYNDGQATYEKRVSNVNGNSHLEDTYENFPSEYNYVTEYGQNHLELRYCRYEECRERPFNLGYPGYSTPHYKDRGGFLTPKEGTYYTRH